MLTMLGESAGFNIRLRWQSILRSRPSPALDRSILEPLLARRFPKVSLVRYDVLAVDLYREEIYTSSRDFGRYLNAISKIPSSLLSARDLDRSDRSLSEMRKTPPLSEINNAFAGIKSRLGSRDRARSSQVIQRSIPRFFVTPRHTPLYTHISFRASLIRFLSILDTLECTDLLSIAVTFRRASPRLDG